MTKRTNLFEASRQWATRPADQRYWTIAEMLDDCRSYADSACQAQLPYNQLSVRPSGDGNDLLLEGGANKASFTHWSYGQLCRRIGAPSDYLRALPAPIAADNINHGLKRIGDDGADLLIHANGSLVCRAFTSDDYSRIWNYELLERLQAVENDGWRVPPARPAFDDQPGCRPATESDVLNQPHGGLDISVGDIIAPAGLYASDCDMFAFLVNDSVRIDDGTEGGLGRGVFVSNSEVGAAALKVTRFLYRYVCGNHIVWDAKDVTEMRIVHRGRNDRRYGRKMVAEMTRYASESPGNEEERIAQTKRVTIGKDKGEVLDKLFGQRLLPRKTLDLAYDRAVQESDRSRDFGPRSVWGMVQGITNLSQDQQHTSARVDLDKAAGKLMTIDF